MDDAITEHMGVRLELGPDIASPSILEALRTGRYEKAEGKYLPAMVDPGDRIVDLGGGIGFTSAIMARTRRAELVVCVEAHPGLIPLIACTRELNGLGFEIRHGAIAPTGAPATLPFHLHKDFWASSLLPLPQDQLRAIVDIPALTFADLRRDYAPSMYVVDIEVLKTLLEPASGAGDGMDGVELEGVRKVVVQIPRSVAGARGVKRVFDWFSAQGFVYDPHRSFGALVLFERLDGAV